MEVFIPKNALQMRDIKLSQWMQQISNKLQELLELSCFDCQARFLGKQT